MADNTATSKISAVKIRSNKTIYIKTTFTKVNDVDGAPRFAVEVREFENGTGTGAGELIATGNTFLNDKRGSDGNPILGGDNFQKIAISPTTSAATRGLLTAQLQPGGTVFKEIQR